MVIRELSKGRQRQHCEEQRSTGDFALIAKEPVLFQWMLAEHMWPQRQREASHWLMAEQLLAGQHSAWLTEPRLPQGSMKTARWLLLRASGDERGTLTLGNSNHSHWAASTPVLSSKGGVLSSKLKSHNSNRHEDSGLSLQMTFHLYHLI